MDLKNKRILITGGAGFIGSHLVRACLDQGARVSVIDNLCTGLKKNVDVRATFYQLDINSAKVETVFKKEKPEFVFLLAFNTNVPKAVQDPLYDIRSLTGNVNILEHCRLHKIKKVVFASSGFVYGNTNQLPTLESAVSSPDNPYCISKITIEKYLQFYLNTYKLDYVALRYATVYGPGQVCGAMADYIRSLYAKKNAIIYGDGTKTRDYIFVDDVVAANFKALTYTPHKNIVPVFNIGTAREYTLNHVYHTIGDILKSKNCHPLYKQDRPGEIMRFCLSNKKAATYLGWKPTIKLDNGLVATVEHFLKNKKV